MERDITETIMDKTTISPMVMQTEVEAVEQVKPVPQKRRRCPKGQKRNKKTGNCEPKSVDKTAERV